MSASSARARPSRFRRPILTEISGGNRGVACGTSAGALKFNRDIRPILADQCFFGLGPDAKKRAAGAIVLGKPDESEMIVRTLSAKPKARMPPAKSKLAPLTPARFEVHNEVGGGLLEVLVAQRLCEKGREERRQLHRRV